MMADGPRILVIDDDPLFCSLIALTLEKEFTVSLANSGEKGFHLACENPPDVAVIDVQMPGWDGLKTLSEFRKHQSLRSTPVIMLTSDASKGTVLTAIEAGADDYVLKTAFSKEEFRTRIAKLAESAGEPVEEPKRESPPDAANDENASADAEALNRSSVEALESPAGLQELVDCWD
ncbi:MAG: hypothetical protein CMJ48_15055 [Planctomycetaceae bacterium]|nr:hypothetical protein [Planctomycetaceae bacterium]